MYPSSCNMTERGRVSFACRKHNIHLRHAAEFNKMVLEFLNER
jgi:hypothetical protein